MASVKNNISLEQLKLFISAVSGEWDDILKLQGFDPNKLRSDLDEIRNNKDKPNITLLSNYNIFSNEFNKVYIEYVTNCLKSNIDNYDDDFLVIQYNHTNSDGHGYTWSYHKNYYAVPYLDSQKKFCLYQFYIEITFDEVTRSFKSFKGPILPEYPINVGFLLRKYIDLIEIVGKKVGYTEMLLQLC